MTAQNRALSAPKQPKNGQITRFWLLFLQFATFLLLIYVISGLNHVQTAVNEANNTVSDLCEQVWLTLEQPDASDESHTPYTP